MLDAQGKPRYWLGTYDAWHLLIPVALAAVLGVWALSPRPRPSRPAAAALPTPMRPSAITIPMAGTNLTVRQFGTIQGTCQPLARVFLFLRQIPNPEQLLAETRSDTNGVFRFTMAPFPPGDYGFRVEAVAADGRRAPSPEIPLRLTTEPPPLPAKKAPAAKPSPKAGTKKAAPTKPPSEKKASPAKKAPPVKSAQESK